MAISSLTVQDFRGFENLEIVFHPKLTVLVGANGAGKTSVLSALSYAHNGVRREGDVRCGAQTAVVSCQPGVKKDDLLFFYGTNRHVQDLTRSRRNETRWERKHARSGQLAAGDYTQFFHWFRDMEDLENEELRDETIGLASRHVGVVRKAIKSLFPAFANIRVRRRHELSSQPCLTLEKRGVSFPLNLLSDGERNTVAMVGDIARRLAIAAGEDLNEDLPDAVVMIDEVEMHLHPGWQRHVIASLPTAFPNCQFIVTTQSPIVVSEVSQENLRMIRDFKVVHPSHSPGRDVNHILEEVFETPARREKENDLLERLPDLLDDGKLEEARKLLDLLIETPGPTDPDVAYYRAIHERLTMRADAERA